MRIRHVDPPTPSDFEHALSVVREHLAPTPLVPSPVAPATFLKLDCLTPAGSFKLRGALAALAALTDAVAKMRLNVLSVEHHRAGLELGVDEVEVLLTVETRDPSHRHEVVRTLRDQGFNVELAR